MAKKKAVSKTRRANNEGSIFQRSDGRWGGALTMGYDENGKIIRKTIYGKTQAEVVKKLSEISGRLKSNSYELVENNNLETLMFEYLMTFKKSAVSPRTFEGNIRNFKLHIAPQIGKMKVYEIDSYKSLGSQYEIILNDNNNLSNKMEELNNKINSLKYYR